MAGKNAFALPSVAVVMEGRKNRPVKIPSPTPLLRCAVLIVLLAGYCLNGRSRRWGNEQKGS